MKVIGFLVGCFLMLSSCNDKPAQSQKDGTKSNSQKDTMLAPIKMDSTVPYYTPTDISPMDMAYYPVNYPKLKMANAISTPPVARIIYSRPHLEGRKMFGHILPYGQVWRLGANEATEIDFYKNVTIDKKAVNAGRYILYCIPDSSQWTIALNSSVDSWGLHIDSTKDVGRFIIPSQKNPYKLEYLTIQFEDASTGANLVMAWENTEARLPIRF